MPVLLLGATLTGLVGVGTILLLRNLTRLKEDTALGAVLSVSFGAGVALLGVIQQMQEGHAAGLEAFICGKTASMGVKDTMLIATAALACIGACLVLFKEFKLLCFDEGFAGSRGLPVVRLDLALMALVVMVCIVGLQAVGLVLMIALLVIPAAAARFWTERMWRMFFISGGVGATSGMVGAGVSALLSKLPSGAMIVLVCTTFFLFSMVFGTTRGVLLRMLRRFRLNRAVDRQHLLRAMYEILEASKPGATIRTRSGQGGEAPRSAGRGGRRDEGAKFGVSVGELLTMRSWSLRRLRVAIDRGARDRLLTRLGEQVCLTQHGRNEAARLTRQHRLWELYLITYADVAPGLVDRDADAIEHVLEPEIVAELEALLEKADTTVPESPHELSPRPSDAATGLQEGL